jgi:hypothetical protein
VEDAVNAAEAPAQQKQEVAVGTPLALLSAIGFACHSDSPSYGLLRPFVSNNIIILHPRMQITANFL